MIRAARIAVVALACVYLALACSRYADSILDDGYIVLRYADNVVAGLGPVFNPGERVEGFTSPLWMALVAAGRAAGLRGESILAGLGTACALLAVAAAWRLGWRLSPGWAALFPPVLLAAHPAHAMWSVHGLETALFVAIVTAALAAWADGTGAGARRAGLALGVGLWTRPEAGLVVAVLAALALVRREGDRARRVVLVSLALAVPLVAARFAYYGTLVPNTYHAKSGGGLGRIAFGLGYAHLFVATHAELVAACAVSALAAAAIARRRRAAAAPRDPAAIAAVDLAAVGVVWSLYVVWVGGDAFPGYRFWLPVLPAAAALAAYGARTALAARAVRATRARLAAASAAVALAGAVLVPLVAVEAAPNVELEHATGMEFTLRMKAAGVWLGANAPPGTTIALNYVGAVPYFSKLPSIDMLGLTDPVVASTPIAGRFRFPGHARGNGASVLDRKPGLILMGGVHITPDRVDGIDPELDSEEQIAADPRFAAEYELVQTPIDAPSGRAWFAFYKRRDLAWRPRSS